MKRKQGEGEGAGEGERKTLLQWTYHPEESALACPTSAHIDKESNRSAARHENQTHPDDEGENSVERRSQSVARWLTMGACVVLLLGIGGILGGALRVVAQDKHMPTTKAEWGQAVGQFFLATGLPDLHTPLWEDPLSVQAGTTQETTPDHTAEPPVETTPDSAPRTLAVVSTDMSLSSLGVYHWQGDEGCVPPAYTDLSTLLTPDRSQVLLVCSHPYATYHTGEDFVELDGESFAVNVTPQGTFPQDGVVSLGERLTAMLQDVGVDAVMLPCASGDAHTQTYETTAERVADYLAEHPEVGVVIDLCRSGELLSGGEVPRSVASVGDIPTAQLQMAVNTGRGVGSTGDYTFAVTLRSLLFAQDPTVSRPVYLRRGEGITASPDVVCLTLALGTAGNTYEEAQALLPHLAEALEQMVP